MSTDDVPWLYVADLNLMTVNELKRECKLRDVNPKAARKQTLINRVLRWQEDNNPPDQEEDDAYELDSDAEEEALKAFEMVDRQAHTTSAGEESEAEDSSEEVEEVFPENDYAYDKEDDALNEAYAKKYGDRPTPRNSVYPTLLAAGAIAASAYATYFYLTAETPEFVAQMY